MAVPAITDFTLYTGTKLTDVDWENNFQVVVNYLTDGTENITVGNITCKAITGVGAVGITGAVTATSFAGDGSALTGIQFVNKNHLINGMALVNQRVTAYTLVKDAYGFGADRFTGMATGTAVSAGTFGQITSANCGKTGYAFKFAGVTLTGTGVMYIRYRMEAKDAVNFIGQTASFSCKTYNDFGGNVNYTVYIRKANAADNFTAVTQISAGTPQVVPTTTETAVKLENVSMGACGNGVEIEIKVEAGAITTKNLEFTELQFEIGTFATGYEYKSFEDELRRCKRYYQKSWAYATAPTTNTAVGSKQMTSGTQGTGSYTSMIPFDTQMRITPSTLTIYDTAGTVGQWTAYKASGAVAGATSSVTADNEQGFAVYSTTATDYTLMVGHFVAISEL